MDIKRAGSRPSNVIWFPPNERHWHGASPHGDDAHRDSGSLGRADGWICGRVNMEPFAGGSRPDTEVAREHSGDAPREDFRAPAQLRSLVFAIDARGRLAWETNDIDGDHVVAILSERVSDEYLAFLPVRSVSYLLAGTHDVDLHPPSRRSVAFSASRRSCSRVAEGSTAACSPQD